MTSVGAHADPLNPVTASSAYWTTVNSVEALPGVSTPLNFSFWDQAVEEGTRRAFAAIGVISTADTHTPADADRRVWNVFHGRAAANLDMFRFFADGTPGTCGDAVELQLFGSVRPGTVNEKRRRRYPIVFAKMPLAIPRLFRALARVRTETDAWWRASVFGPPPADASAARAMLAGAAQRFAEVMPHHILCAMLGQGLYDQVCQLATKAGRPGLEGRLLTGQGTVEESRVLDDLWEVSRGRQTLEAFLSHHGYHGPAEGEISSRSWRDDPATLQSLLEPYRALDDAASPLAVQEQRAVERRTAEQELLANLPALRRGGARLVLKLAGRMIPARETGKVACLQALDVGRAAAHALGGHLVATGVLDEPDDVFYLTLPELLGELPHDIHGAVAFRRQRREEYLAQRLPEGWSGLPTPTLIADEVDGDGQGDVAGLGVSPGVAEGRARVVFDPAAAELEPGEILVCETTDPSWATLFLVAGGLVIDIGGALSHGAIVARELGIPCVINTRRGTRQLHDGDRLRIDGGTGAVEVVERAPATAQGV